MSPHTPGMSPTISTAPATAAPALGTQAPATPARETHEDRSATIFPTGTFTPAPQASTPAAMLRSQTVLELKLIVRHGEQLLLTLLIPLTMLIGLTLLPIGDIDEPRINHVLPLVLAVAIMSTAFTGQAIAVGFDRRYGALKRLGATALPKWAIIGGKSCAVGIVIVGQMVILCVTALFLDWRPSLGEVAAGAPPVVLGALAFATMGLLIGGTLKAEIVLALANILWFAMLGIAGLVLMDDTLPAALDALVTIVPSGALATALSQALDGGVAVAALAILAAWALVCGLFAVRTFKFE